MQSLAMPARALAALLLAGALSTQATGMERDDMDKLIGQPADVASSAYLYRADRKPDDNPPESWVLLIQHAGLPYDRPVPRESPPG